MCVLWKPSLTTEALFYLVSPRHRHLSHTESDYSQFVLTEGVVYTFLTDYLQFGEQGINVNWLGDSQIYFSERILRVGEQRRHIFWLRKRFKYFFFIRRRLSIISQAELSPNFLGGLEFVSYLRFRCWCSLISRRTRVDSDQLEFFWCPFLCSHDDVNYCRGNHNFFFTERSTMWPWGTGLCLF